MTSPFEVLTRIISKTPHIVYILMKRYTSVTKSKACFVRIASPLGIS